MKKSKVVNFMPKTDYVNTYAPQPEPMSKNLPVWWRTQEPYVGGKKQVINGAYNETIKKCPGIQDLLFTGYLLKFPCDIYIDTTEGSIQFDVHEVHQPSFSMHKKDQVASWDFSREQYMDDVFRVHPMWVVGTQKGYSTLFVHPSFHDSLPFRIVPAIVDTDMYWSDGWFSVIIERGFKGVIEKGTPLVQCIPFKREQFEMNILDKPDLKILNAIPHRIRSMFGNAYKTYMWEKKVFK
jgi:hypothetical protein